MSSQKKSEEIPQRTHFCIGLEPFFKYIKSERIDEFYDYALDSLNYQHSYGFGRTLAISKSYNLERIQAGFNVKGVLKKIHKRFNLDLELGLRCFYKIVKLNGIDENLDYYHHTIDASPNEFYFKRYNGLAISPFINLKLGRLF